MFSFYNLLTLGPITKAPKALLPTTYGEKTANIYAPKASCPNPFALGQKPVRCLGWFFSRSSKSAFCLSTSLKAPCWRFPILAMAMFEQARRCSFGLTKTFFSRSSKSAFCLSTSLKAPCRRFPILAMTMFEQARRCSFGLTKTFYKLGKAAWDSDIQFTEPTQTRNH